jgi:quinol monooxygenase YgiN
MKPFWRARVEEFSGVEKGYFLLEEGNPAWTLSVVLFESKSAMDANTHNTLGTVAQQAARFRTSEPDLHPREVLAHVPGHAGKMGYARVANVEFDPKDVDKASAVWPSTFDAYQAEAGFRHAYFCGDRQSGKVASISFWASKADAEANEASGAFQAAVAPLKAVMTKKPKVTHWDVAVVVG